jgi:hypothetical protein
VAATIRIAGSRFDASTTSAVGSSVGGGSASLTVVLTGPTIRIGGSGFTTVSSVPTIRISGALFATPVGSQAWSGTAWVDIPENPNAAVGSSVGAGVASLSPRVTLTAAGSSSGAGSAAVLIGMSGSIDVPVNTVVTVNGAVNVTPGSFSGSINLTANVVVTLTGNASQGAPGQGSLTVVPEPGSSPPRMLLELAGGLGPSVTITRVDQAGNSSPVRLANPAPLSGGTAVVYDYEAPDGQPVQYVAVTTSATITSDTVTLDVATPRLIHPVIPDLSMPIYLMSRPQRTRTISQGVFRPIGRATAVVRTDDARYEPTFDLTVGTRTLEEEAALIALLTDGSPLLLQVGYEGQTRRDYVWVSVGEVTEAPVNPAWDDTYTVWTLPCTVTDAPAGTLQSQRTWDDVTAENATWDDVVANYATWNDLITGTRIGD